MATGGWNLRVVWRGDVRVVWICVANHQVSCEGLGNTSNEKINLQRFAKVLSKERESFNFSCSILVG